MSIRNFVVMSSALAVIASLCNFSEQSLCKALNGLLLVLPIPLPGSETNFMNGMGSTKRRIVESDMFGHFSLAQQSPMNPSSVLL